MHFQRLRLSGCYAVVVFRKPYHNTVFVMLAVESSFISLPGDPAISTMEVGPNALYAFVRWRDLQVLSLSRFTSLALHFSVGCFMFSSRFAQAEDYILPSKRPPSAVGTAEAKTWELADGWEPQDLSLIHISEPTRPY